MSDSTRTLHDYWDSFYAGPADLVPEDPTAFARWVVQRLAPGQQVIELGFGTARDSLWFAEQGHPVTGYDFAEHAVERAQGRADGADTAASFSILDLYDANAVNVVADKIAATGTAPALYARFLIHSLEEDGRANLFDLAALTLADGGELFLEFRTGQDKGARHVFGDDHFRVFLDPDVVVREIEDRGGTTTHNESGHGFAVYKDEDPHVARIVARWSA